MEGFAKEVCQRAPLAEATLRLLDFITQEDFLRGVFEQHRGRSYEGVISFPLLVQLVSDALLQHGGSGHRSFQQAVESEQLETTIRAPYRKLERVPVPLSVGFFSAATRRLEEVFPTGQTSRPSALPKSLRAFEPTAIDGKKIKHVPKRLKALRSVRGHVLGGKLVAALSLRTNLVTGLSAHPDGEVSDAPLVPDLLAQMRATRERPRLWVADRQFCDLIQPAQYAAEGDSFLIRYNAKVKFHRDPQRPGRTGLDDAGRTYREQWGWLGSPQDPRRRYVRRITLERPDAEELSLVTDLLDAEQYPASDLLAVYLLRWGSNACSSV